MDRISFLLFSSLRSFPAWMYDCNKYILGVVIAGSLLLSARRSERSKLENQYGPDRTWEVAFTLLVLAY